jgi:hypothetical protein
MQSWNLDSNGMVAKPYPFLELSCDTLKVGVPSFLLGCSVDARLSLSAVGWHVSSQVRRAGNLPPARLLALRRRSPSIDLCQVQRMLGMAIAVYASNHVTVSGQATYSYSVAALRINKTDLLVDSVEFSASGSASTDLKLELAANFDQQASGELGLLSNFKVYGAVLDIAGVHVQLGVFLDLKFRFSLSVSAAGTLTTAGRGPVVWEANYMYIAGKPDVYNLNCTNQFEFDEPVLNLDAGAFVLYRWACSWFRSSRSLQM